MIRTFIRDHIRLVIGSLVMVFVAGVLCLPSKVQSFVRPIFINSPTGLIVTATASSSVSLSWNAVAGVHHYQVERSDNMAGPFTTVGNNVTTTTFTDGSVSSLRAYIYRARAIAIDFDTGQNVISTPSNMAIATAITFLPTQLPGQPIFAQHVYDLRTAINAMRAVAFLPAANWARGTLNGFEIRASDVQELRNRLDEALAVLQVPVLSYQDPLLSTGANGTPIRAAHLDQLRTRSTQSSSNSSGPLYPNASRAAAGEFGPTKFLPLVPVHLSVLPNRKVLFWGRDLVIGPDGKVVETPKGEAKQVVGRSEVYLWDLVGTPEHVDNLTANLFCSGHSFLPDGRLFVAGGHANPDFDGAGERQTNIFDYEHGVWKSGPLMDHGRWYPYNVTLGSGEVVVLSGFYNDTNDSNATQANLDTQLYKVKLDSDVNTPEGSFSDLDDAATTITTYPYLHLTPSGKILQAQSGGFFVCFSADCFRGRKGGRLLNPSAALGTQWQDIPDGDTLPHAQGSAVLFDSGRRVLLVGGYQDGQHPSKEAESMELPTDPNATTQPNWFRELPMNFKRSYHTATILPNGKVLVTGGVSCQGGNNIETLSPQGLSCSGGQVMNAEMWDPATGQWTIMAPQKEIRAYHSVAALLPDGTVLVGGGGRPGAVGEDDANGRKITDGTIRKPDAMAFGHNNVEIYSPPYLFDANGNPAARPVITSWPNTIATGDTIFIGTSGTGNMPKVSLVRLPSVTHGFNQDQRQITLDPVLANGGLFVTAPASPNQCPPGFYMLFVLNTAGVPSVAQIVRVQNASVFPTAVPVTTATGAGLTWEQGIEFSSMVNGQITHIRFWKAAGEPSGGHVGHIWNAVTGAELASVQFFNETSSGWQEAQLSTPLPMTAGVRYKVTYNVNSLVAKTFDAVSHPVLSWPLIGWGSSFSTPAGTFPTSGSTSNLFADVRFK